MNVRELKEIIKDLPDDMEIKALIWNDKMWEYDRVVFKIENYGNTLHIVTSYN